VAYLRTFSLRRAALAVVAVLAGVASQAKADIMIDDFSSPSTAVEFNITQTNTNPFTVTTALGGGISRTATFTVTSPTTPGNGALTGSVGGGFLTASYNFASSGTVSIAYSFASAINFIPNVAAGGAVGALQFLGAGDSGFGSSIPLSISLTTSTGNLGFSGSLPLTTSPSPVNVGLDSLTGTGNLTAVTGLTINITGAQAADLFFDALGVTTPAAPPPTTGVIPAPPAALLALMVVPALGLRRKFAKKA
jgi:hypothetical protein